MRFPVGPLRGPDPSERVSVEARSDSRRQMRNRRIKAVLAGGLVFGIGSAATLAAWTDTEEASGSFKAGTFNIERAVNGSWSSSPKMTFDASGMYPGSKVYAPVFVRTTPNTTMAGDLVVSSAGATVDAGGIAESLEYRAVTSSLAPGDESSFTCNENSFSGSSTYVYGGASTTVPLASDANGDGKQAIKPNAGDVRAYCFEVTLRTDTPSTAQGSSAANTWTFGAESIETPSDGGES